MGVTLLIIMIIITIILCALVNKVKSQTNDVFPAKILVPQKTISENSDLYVTCSTFGLKEQITVYVYLYNGDLCIEKKKQKRDQNDTNFIIPRVGLHHSGSYSCFYSINNDSLSKVAQRGLNVIQILVISNFLPADISVAGPSAVTEGDDVAFRCTVSDTLQTLGKCQLIHSYLRRDETILQVQAFNVTRMEATFTIQGAVTRDSGRYSCVVLPSKCIQEHERTLHGNNAVSLEVKGSLVLLVSVFCGLITLMLLLGLCLWWINKRAGSGSCNPCAASQQANADMAEEQQVQTEGEDLEAQDGDSFSMEEEEEEYQNAEVAEESSITDDYEGAYSMANDPTARQNPACVYASSKRRTTRSSGLPI
ncbi:uncharacterized protein LOC141752943 [Sebastes fasciatus]|uniref:uncharacterized protein LOC141752943 n=1 Tax=Sebastes fasciatus TaxID=394691 RepID=UPI003D9EB581